MIRGIALLAVAGCAHAASARPEPPVQLEVLLDESLAKASAMGALTDGFDVSPGHLLLVSDADRAYLVGWGGVVPVEGLPGKLESLAYTASGLLLVAHDADLEYANAAGQLALLFAVPNAHMGLARGEGDVMYLFDRESPNARYGLYELAPGRRARKVLESPQAIDDVAAGGGRLFFASGGVIFEATARRPVRLVASLPGGARIRTLATDARGERVYFSDGRAIYRIVGRTPTLVSRAFGGTLHVRDGALVVLDASHHLLVRFRELP